MHHYLEIIHRSTGQVVKRIDVTGKTNRQVDKLDDGLNINMNHAEYYTGRDEYETAQVVGNFDLPTKQVTFKPNQDH